MNQSILINVKPCKNNIGAFIDTNLAEANNDIINKIKIALDEFGVVFFSNQNLDSSSYVQFAKKFGVCADYARLKGLDGYPEITVVEKKADEKMMFGEGWHTDSCYTQNPPKITMLYSIKTPEKGKGNTLFASQYASYDDLSIEDKIKIKNLKAEFSADGPISNTLANRIADSGKDVSNQTLSAIHPIVKINERNKKKSIYLSPGHVIKIVDIEEKKSTSLLKFLIEHQVKSDFIYSFEWEPNCLAIWSNQSVLHSPVNDFAGKDRIMHRITIE